MAPGVTMTVEAPLHANGLYNLDDVHLIHATVTTYTTNPGGQMDAVVEVGVIGKFMHAHPRHGLSSRPALPQRLKHRRILLDHRMAPHAGLRRRDHGVRRRFNIRMAVSTVESQLPDMKPVAV